MPERRHYRIHIENAGEVAKRVASGIGDTVAERLDHLRDHHPDSRVVRNVAIGVGAGAAAVVGGGEVIRRLKGRRAAQQGKDKIDGSNPDTKQTDLVPAPDKKAGAENDIYGVELPTISVEVMSWIDDTDNVRGGKKDVPLYMADFLGDVAGADVNDVEESLREAIRKRERIFGAYFRELNHRVLEDVRRRGFEVDPKLDSPLGDFENYSPNHSKQSLIRELGYQAEQTPAEFAANIKSEIDCLEMSYIRQSALPALEKFRSARGMSTFAEIAEMRPRDLSGKDLVKLNLVSAEEAEAYKNNKQDVSEEEPTIDEYAKRVKDLIEAAEQLEGDIGPVKSFDELRDFEDKILAVRIDSGDCLNEVYTSLSNGGEFISDDLIRRERERTNPPIPTPTLRPTQEDDPRRQGNRCSTTKKIALAFAAGAALIGGAWISHELTEDNGGNTTSLSYNIDLSHNSLNAFGGSNVDHVVQGNNYLGNNGGESRSGNTNGGAKQGTEQAPSNGSGQDGTSNGNGVEAGGKKSGSLTPQEAKDYIDNLDGQKDGKLRVVISKADGSGGIDTLDWALARTLKTDKFNSQNPSINGVARWQDTSAAIADQRGKTAEDFHWVNDKQVVDLNVGDHMAQAFIDANVPLVKSASAQQAPDQSTTPDNGVTKGTQTPDASKTPTKTPSVIATGTETQTPTMAPTRTPAVDVVTNTPIPSVTATATITATATGTATAVKPSPTSTATAPIEVPVSPKVVVKSGPRTGFGGNKDEDPAWMAFAAAALGATGAAALYKGMKFGRLPLFSDDEDEGILARRIITDRKEKREEEGDNK